MRKLFIVALLSILAFPLMATVGPNWIEQWGITWTFNKNISTDGAVGTYQYGTFANGDYWVKGPVSIIQITPKSETVDFGGSWTKKWFNAQSDIWRLPWI